MRPTIPLLALVCLIGIAELVQARHASSHEWAHYKRKHGKVYASAEEDAHRFARFLAAKENIQRHNANPAASYKMALNHLSDWTEEELARLNGIRHQDAAESQLDQASQDPFLQAILDDPAPVPDELDWRKVPNRVSAVKDQGMCGSCWAFAATGVLEGQEVARNFTTQVVPLSEQDLVDCSKEDAGCNGGIMSSAFKDMIRMGGIESERDYPYRAATESCKFNKKKLVMNAKGAVDLPPNDEATLKQVVAKYGPVSTVMDASGLSYYRSGIYEDPDCTKYYNHGVLVVGYGVDPKHGDYWIVKNSWTDLWGESGYFRMKRGKAMCAIGTLSTIVNF